MVITAQSYYFTGEVIYLYCLYYNSFNIIFISIFLLLFSLITRFFHTHWMYLTAICHQNHHHIATRKISRSRQKKKIFSIVSEQQNCIRFHTYYLTQRLDAHNNLSNKILIQLLSDTHILIITKIFTKQNCLLKRDKCCSAFWLHRKDVLGM